MHVRVDGMDNLPNTALLTNPVSALALVQSKFGLMKLSGEIRIIELVDITKSQLAGETRGVNFYRKPDAELLIKRFLETLPIPSDTKKVIGDFWVNPNTFVYDAIAFSPLATPATTLNYWIGHTANPNAGDWSVIGDFLLHVICDGDKKVFLYLLCYLAHMLQKPEEKPGIMIVMLGAQGTGKGTFFFLMKRIWSKTALQVADVDQVIGRFNAALEQNYVILMDEALFAGDKKSTEKLKSLITEPSIGIEQKYQPSRTIDSYHRFFAASNNDHFAHIDRDDRRFLFLRVSSARQGNSEYFKTLFNSINDEAVIGAMVYDLIQMDLSSFNVRQRPKTKEHLKQKIQSLSGFERYWYEVVVNRGIPGPHRYVEQWSSSMFVSTKEIVEGYKQYDKNAERYNTIQTQTIADKLGKLCPSARQSRCTVNGSQERGYDLPSIDVARQEFEGAMGGTVNWGWGPTPQPQQVTQPLTAQELEWVHMRETYEMDDGSVGPEEEVYV